MAKPTASIEELLSKLASAHGPGEKLRLLARSWARVRDLPQQQRQQVAMALGSRWAARHLERIFARDGELTDEELLFKQTVERIGEADPEELRELAATVRQGDTGVFHTRFLGVLERVLEAEARAGEEKATASPDEAAETSPEGAREERAEAEVVEMVEALEAAALPAPVAVPFPVGAEAPAESPEAAGPSAGEPEETPPEKVEPPPPVGKVPEEPPAFEEREPTDPLLSAVSRLRQLQDLRLGADAVAAMDRAGRSRLLSRLGPGWASRRGVSQMIRSRSLADLDEALHLIGHLASPAQQSWCLGDLLAHWELEGRDLEKLLDAAPTPASRRRLERRAHRSRAPSDRRPTQTGGSWKKR
ncbi:MAG: hypothetical protein V3T81_09645 [Thermoanaerobaculia bacterium]